MAKLEFEPGKFALSQLCYIFSKSTVSQPTPFSKWNTRPVCKTAFKKKQSWVRSLGPLVIGMYWEAAGGCPLEYSLKIIFFFNLAASGLSCSLRNPSLPCAGSLVVARGLGYPVSCKILVPPPGIKLSSPALEGGFLTTRPPGKSLPWSPLKNF